MSKKVISDAETLSTLKAARALLTPVGCWIQNSLARDAENRDVYEDTDAGPACKWCMIGAIRHVLGLDAKDASHNHSYMAPLFALRAALREDEKWDGELALFNDADYRTSTEILALYDKAIAILEKKIDLTKKDPDELRAIIVDTVEIIDLLAGCDRNREEALLTKLEMAIAEYRKHPKE